MGLNKIRSFWIDTGQYPDKFNGMMNLQYNWDLIWGHPNSCRFFTQPLDTFMRLLSMRRISNFYSRPLDGIRCQKNITEISIYRDLYLSRSRSAWDSAMMSWSCNNYWQEAPHRFFNQPPSRSNVSLAWGLGAVIVETYEWISCLNLPDESGDMQFHITGDLHAESYERNFHEFLQKVSTLIGPFNVYRVISKPITESNSYHSIYWK